MNVEGFGKQPQGPGRQPLNSKPRLWGDEGRKIDTSERGHDRDETIKNQSLWGDCFSTMGRWSRNFLPQARLVWASCTGIPLDCFLSQRLNSFTDGLAKLGTSASGESVNWVVL
ncbi:hypothetical protein Q3G72_007274 [Acer saccharum]|nr:hypothetical protein Q3G72_007274 [Acer saccharum]